MKTTWKRVVAIFLAGAIIFAIAACSSDKTEQSQKDTAAGNGKLFAENTEINIMIASHAS